MTNSIGNVFCSWRRHIRSWISIWHLLHGTTLSTLWNEKMTRCSTKFNDTKLKVNSSYGMQSSRVPSWRGLGLLSMWRLAFYRERHSFMIFIKRGELEGSCANATTFKTYWNWNLINNILSLFSFNLAVWGPSRWFWACQWLTVWGLFMVWLFSRRWYDVLKEPHLP